MSKCPFSLCDHLACVLCFEKLGLGAEILPYLVLIQNIIVQLQPKVLDEGERWMHWKVCSWDHHGACWAWAQVPAPKAQPDWDHGRDVLPFFHFSPGSFLSPPKDYGTLCDSGSSWCSAGARWKWGPVATVWGAGYFLVLFQNSCVMLTVKLKWKISCAMGFSPPSLNKSIDMEGGVREEEDWPRSVACRAGKLNGNKIKLLKQKL